MPYNYNPYEQHQFQHYIVSQSCRNIKRMAKQTLQGRWGQVILAAFLIEFICSAPSLILNMFSSKLAGFISDLYSIVITGPATVGLAAYYLGTFRMQDPAANLVFSGISRRDMFFKGLLVYCSVMIKVILWSFLLLIPGLIAAYKYSLSFKVLADHPEYTPSECLSASAALMKGNKASLFLLNLSFWFWYIVVSIPRGLAVQKAMAIVPSLEALLTDTSVFTEYFNTVQSNPIIIISYVLGVILNVYVQMSECCFYDLAAGNLVVRQAQPGE